jgi:hypothetical protein
MNDQELLRYSRHILLDDIGIEGQEKILSSHVVVIGAGGLGSAALLPPLPFNAFLMSASIVEAAARTLVPSAL